MRARRRRRGCAAPTLRKAEEMRPNVELFNPSVGYGIGKKKSSLLSLLLNG
jgi:hypothetical protein